MMLSVSYRTSKSPKKKKKKKAEDVQMHLIQTHSYSSENDANTCDMEKLLNNNDRLKLINRDTQT